MPTDPDFAPLRWACACGFDGQATDLKPTASGGMACPDCGGTGGLTSYDPTSEERPVPMREATAHPCDDPPGECQQSVHGDELCPLGTCAVDPGYNETFKPKGRS